MAMSAFCPTCTLMMSSSSTLTTISFWSPTYREASVLCASASAAEGLTMEETMPSSGACHARRQRAFISDS